jgi:hypothetical protein
VALARLVQRIRPEHQLRALNEKRELTMMIRNSLGLMFALMALGAGASIGCSEAERTYDCSRVCTRYAECIDDGVDTVECTDRCEDQAQEDPDFADQANDCEHCIDDESCASATVECATKCAWVVDEST